MKTILLLSFCGWLFLTNNAYAQQDSSLLKNVDDSAVNKTMVHVSNNPETDLSRITGDDLRDAIDKYYKDKWMKSPEFTICILLLLFGFLICLAEVILFLKGKLQQYQIIKLLIITLIIFSVLFLIASGYSNDQIGPAFGLLGTIAGYLLGKAPPSANTPLLNDKSNENE